MDKRTKKLNIKIRRIQQKSTEKADCGIACVAMVTGKSYSDVFSELSHKDKDGEYYTRHQDLIKVIKKLGKGAVLKVEQKRFNEYKSISGLAIVAVNKRKERKGRYWHWIVFNGEGRVPYILDPKPGKYGKITDFRGLRAFGNYIQIIYR